MNIKDFRRGDWLFFGSIACGLLAIFVTGQRIPLATMILVVCMLGGMLGSLLLKKRDN